MQGRMNLPIRGGGGEGVSLNVFAQSTEPTTKEGIWINTSATGSLPAISKFEYEGIEISNYDYEVGDLNWFYEKLNDTLNFFYRGCAVSHGGYIYLFGCIDSLYRRKCVRYDPINDKYTMLSDIPYDFYQGCAVSHGNYIYLLGGLSNDTNCYRYDPENDTYTQLSDIPYNFYSGCAVSHGDYIYLFSTVSSTSAMRKFCYRYDPENDAYTRLSDTTSTHYYGYAVSHGDYIYLFGGGSTAALRKRCYRYDPENDTYTQLSDIPYAFINSCAVSQEDYIYLFGGSSEGYQNCYRYDPENDTYTQLSDIPYEFYYGCAVLHGDYIHLIGGNYSKKLHYKISTIQLTNNHIYLFATTDRQNVELVDEITVPICKARIYANNTFKEYPVYYGDGTQWNLLST